MNEKRIQGKGRFLNLLASASLVLAALQSVHAQSSSPSSSSASSSSCGAPATGPGACVADQPASKPDPSPTASASNPINTITGNKYQREVDLPALPGVLGLEIVRHYNSDFSGLKNTNGIMGRGWKLSYETRLSVQGAHLEVIQADGRRIAFQKELMTGQAGGVSPSDGKIVIRAGNQGPEYTWVWPSGRKLTFDAQGKLLQIAAPTGEFVTLQYDPKGLLIQVIDPQGRRLKLNYPERSVAEAGRFKGVQSVDSPVGRFVYEYGSPIPKEAKVAAHQLAANLVRVQIPTQYNADTPAHGLTSRGTSSSDLARIYHYEDARFPTLLTGISVQGKDGKSKADRIERLATYGYDERGWAVRSAHGYGIELARIDRADEHNAGHAVLVHSKSAQSPQGQKLEIWSRQIAGAYRITETRGVACPTVVPCPEANMRYRYDDRGLVIEAIKLDAQGLALQGTRTEYDVVARPVRVSKVGYKNGKPAGELLLVRYEYGGKPASERQQRDIPTNVYSDKPVLIAMPSVVAGQERSFNVSYNEFGQPTRIAETGWSPAVGDQAPSMVQRVTTNTYTRINGRSVLISSDGPLPSSVDTTRLEWDAAANYVVRVLHPLALAHSYDKRDQSGRLLRETPPDGVAIERSYLPLGQEASWRRGPAVASVEHDVFLRPLRIGLPDGEVRRIGYGSGGMADQALAMVSNTGRAQWLGPMHRSVALQAASMSPSRERLQGLVQDQTQTNAIWAEQRAVVDDFGRLIALYTRDTGWERRSYDLADRLTRRALSDGTEWDWQRDALGRIVAHEVSKPGAKKQRTELQYEGTHLVRVTHPNESERLVYDDLGRIKAKSIWRGTQHYTDGFEYDKADRLTSWRLPEGGSLHYSWGPGKQLKAIEYDDGQANAVLGDRLSNWLSWGRHVVIEPLRETAGQPAATSASSVAHGDLPALLQAQALAEQGYRWGNGVELRWHLGEQGQLAGMRYVGTGSQAPWHERLLAWLPSAQAAARSASPSPGALIELGYEYDAWGRMSHRRQDGIRTGYAYDGLGRLLVSQQLTAGATVPEVEYYAYDEQGRMNASQVMASDRDWRQVRTQRDVSGLPLAIEGAGTSARGLRYSADRRLIEVRQDGKLLASYSHNTHGQRIGKVVFQAQHVEHADGALGTQYLWSQGQLVGETLPQAANAPALGAANESSFRLARRYVYAHGVPVAVIDHEGGAVLREQHGEGGGQSWLGALWRWVSEPAPAITSLHANEIGTPIAATDARGKLVWRAEYSAYGVQKAVSRPTSASDKRGQQGQHGKTFDLNLRLPGQYFDAETGWYDNGLRTYDPQRGTYLEPDPLGPVPNWASGRLLTQPYAYANHNPLIYADPTGLILFAFDGTGNSDPAQDGASLSNVQKFYSAYDKDQSGKAYYITGIGTTNKDMSVKGSEAVGTGFRERLDLGTKFLEGYIKDNNADNGKWLDIDVVGFSRGAAEARAWVSQIEKKLNESRVFSSANTGDNKRCINFRFLGVWDTVPHLGADHGDEDQYDFSIPASVKLAVHAVAVNEHRGGLADFDVESIHANATIANSGNRIERGFAGAHSDIGGGYAEGDLSDVALMWMIGQARGQGIAFVDEKITSGGWNVVSNPVVHDSRIGKGFKEWLWSDSGDREMVYVDDSRVKQEKAEMHAGVPNTSKAREAITYFEKGCGNDGTIVGLVDVKKYEAWVSDIGVTFEQTPAVPDGCKIKK